MFIGAMAAGAAVLILTAGNASGVGSGSPASGTVTSTNGPSIVVDNGVGTLTYSYSHLSTTSGSTPTLVSGGDTDSPSFRATVSDGTPSTSSWRVTVTDAMGRSETADFTVNLTYIQNV